MSKSNTPSLKANVIMNIAYEMFSIIIPFITGPYISRILHADGIGTDSYLASLLSYFTIFASLGTNAYGTYSIARERNDKEKLSTTFWEIEILSLITSGIAIIGWLVFATMYKEYRILMYIQTLNLLSTALSIAWLFAGMEKFQYKIFISTIIRIICTLSIFIFVKSSNDLWIYILISSCANFFGVLTLWLFVPLFICKCKISLRNIFCLRLKETLIYFIPTIATSIYAVLDKSLLGIITRDSYQNGYYEQASSIINTAKTASFFAIHGVMTSRASFYFKNDREELSKGLLLQDLDIVSFLSVGAAFGIAVVSKTFVPLFFGNGYDPTIYILYILCAVIPIIGLSNALGSIYYTPSGRRMQSTWYLIIGSVVNLFLNIILIPKFAAYGASVATVIAELIITIIYVTNARRFISPKRILIIYWKKIAAGILMLAVEFYFEKNVYLSMNVYILLIFKIIIGLIVYVVTLVVMRDCSITYGIYYLKNFYKQHKQE